MKPPRLLLFFASLTVWISPLAQADGPPQIACAQDADCGEQEYCKRTSESCSEAAEVPQGTCSRKPEICTREYRPVCGCNRKTYSNACVAASQGMNIASQGACPEKDTAVDTQER